MKSLKQNFTLLAIFTLLFSFVFTACQKDDDDDDDEVVLSQTNYDLSVKDVLGVTGIATFIKTTNAITIELNLNGPVTGNHPAHIHYNTALEGGGIAISLNPVDANGKSTTSISTLDNNNPITYEELIMFDGYLNVHKSPSELGVIMAQGDIGGNVLTGSNRSYNLAEANSSGVSGTALFEKRKNNNTLVTLSLNGTLSGGSHPAYIHLGDVNTVGGGPVVANLSNVNGTTGKSYTNVNVLQNGTPITYENWIVYDGYITVVESTANQSNILSEGNIGE